MIFHWRQWKWQMHFALLQEMSLLLLAFFCQSRAEYSQIKNYVIENLHWRTWCSMYDGHVENKEYLVHSKSIDYDFLFCFCVYNTCLIPAVQSCRLSHLSFTWHTLYVFCVFLIIANFLKCSSKNSVHLNDTTYTLKMYLLTNLKYDEIFYFF